MSSITRATRKAIEMSGGQDAEPEAVSDYAPRPRQGGDGGGGNPVAIANASAPYLTDAMIAPSGNMNLGDPIRLTQMAGPALDQIGKLTADKIELSARTLVENARRGAETILAEAQAQATDMIAMAETQAADMVAFSKSIRRYTDRKASQVGEFCAVAESIVTTMHGLASNFQSVIAAEVAAEKEEQERPIQIPAFLARKAVKAAT